MTGFFTHWDNLWNGTYQFYDDVCSLRKEIDSEISKMEKARKRQHIAPSPLENTARQFRARLHLAIEKYESTEKKPQNLFVLGTETADAIFDYEPSLIAAPDLINQIKAFINNVLEKAFNAKPFFTPDYNELGLKQEFNVKYFKVKNQIREWRDKQEALANQACIETLENCCKF
jgi:hypothetical protein